MTTKKLTKLLALYLPYILLGLVATNLGEAWRLAEGKELGEHSRWHLRILCPVCIRWICLLAFPAAQGYGLPYICGAKMQRSTVMAWSTALPGGAMRKTLNHSWLPSFPTTSF